MSGLLVDLAPDAAAVRANALVTVADSDGHPTLVMGEVYRLGASRTADGWRLTSVVTAPVWKTGELPAGVSPRRRPAPAAGASGGGC